MAVKKRHRILFSEEVINLFNKIIDDFQPLKEMIFCQMKQKRRNNIRSHKRWNAKRKAARQQKG